jgi:hypothetical protein
MSTNDVPGANPANSDQLRMGCWAEHNDGSLIFVKSVEGSRVIYEMYDTSVNPIIQYTDAMKEEAFKKQFSWNPSDKNSIKWTWHDKTAFPWDRIIKHGARDGVSFASAQDQISAAARVALSMALSGKNIDKETMKHLVDSVTPHGQNIISKIQSAINDLPSDDKIAKKKAKILRKAMTKLSKLDPPKMLEQVKG